ncbi:MULTISPECIES: hypothetical protein [Hydrocarboniphaga]|uniref:hypothetical protein n=1 Tax=Hydrocarboniphaga TaxID=243627 RepID=UPI0012FC0A4D|nr:MULTISPECIES: hypothetical protein [Hydrocarboniphaga]MDZ4078639.1 hypothetical protein [Hydrocarboniphaga sp.]
MTDGPFKNLQLANRWKRYTEAVQNHLVARDTVRAMACNAIVRDVLFGSNRALLNAVDTHVSQAQQDFDAIASVEGIFSRYSKSPFADSLQRELVFRLDSQAPAAAYDEAITAAISGHISEVGNRIVEECIRSYESDQMNRSQLTRTITQSKATLRSIDLEELCRAVRSGNTNAFKLAASKKDGLDEGPPL